MILLYRTVFFGLGFFYCFELSLGFEGRGVVKVLKYKLVAFYLVGVCLWVFYRSWVCVFFLVIVLGFVVHLVCPQPPL